MLGFPGLVTASPPLPPPHTHLWRSVFQRDLFPVAHEVLKPAVADCHVEVVDEHAEHGHAAVLDYTVSQHGRGVGGRQVAQLQAALQPLLPCLTLPLSCKTGR